MTTSTIESHLTDLEKWGYYLQLKKQKHIKDIIDDIRWPILDPKDPIKYDAMEWIIESYMETLPDFEKRLVAIEEHLEKGLPEGKPFIRPEERPAVGDEMLQQLSDSVLRLNERLESIENKIQ